MKACSYVGYRRRSEEERSMRTRHALALGLVVPALLVAASVTAAQSDDPAAADGPTFAAIQRGATDQYFIDLQAGFRERIEELGGDALTYDAKEDVDLAVSLMN